MILYKSLVRSHLEYSNSVWSKKIDVDKQERVQKRAKLIPELPERSFSDRLKALNLPALKYRRFAGDITEVFKICQRYIRSDMCSSFQFCRTIK